MVIKIAFNAREQSINVDVETTDILLYDNNTM
jgi:hypothetical protein